MKGLPFPNGDRIVEIRRDNIVRGIRRSAIPIADIVDYRAQQRTLDKLAAYYSGTVNVSGTGDPERYTGAWVTASAFDVPHVNPLIGRVVRAGEDTPGGEAVAVISYRMWKRRFGGDSAAVGQTIRANGSPFTIVGVMPEGYVFPNSVDIWLPLRIDPLAGKRGDGESQTLIGTLKPGVTIQQAAADFSKITKQLGVQYKESNEGFDTSVQPFVEAELGPQPRQLLYTMLGAVFFVLLIACVNVANLLLDRAAHKSREVGIRTALGAHRGAIIRQFLTEALVLSVAGALLGALVANGAIALFNRSLVDTDPPFFIDIRMHPMVLLFTAGVTVLATLLAGVFPAVQSARTDINEVLKDESRGSSSLHIGKISRGLVVFEIALSCGLLVASGLMIKSVTKLKTMDPGFRTANVFTARLGFPSGYNDTTMQRNFYSQLQETLAGLPGARGAAIASQLPGVGSKGKAQFSIDGVAYSSPRDLPNSNWTAVSAGYFETFDVRVLQGRGIVASDHVDSDPVAVVNRAFADKYFGGKDPVGHRIRLGGLTSTEPWMTIVGIVPTTFSGNPDTPRDAAFYVPLLQHHSQFVSIAVQTASAPMAVTTPVRAVITGLNRDLPIYWVYSMDEALARPTWYIRVFGTMFMVFGVIALFLASVGLYAVMSFSVSRRTKEVGIRMALGAAGGDVVRMIFRQGAWQMGIGMVLGLGLAAGVAQVMSVVLFDVQPRDPSIFGGVALVLAVAGLMACLLPARRATRVNPLTALRS
jgi:predicted permease